MKTSIIGIDPGNSGGIAIIDQSGTPEAFKFPDTETDTKNLLKSLMDACPKRIAYLEKVGPARGKNDDGSTRTQGVSSAFTFGQSYGFLRGLLVALEIPFEDVSPQRWQNSMGLVKKGLKLGQTERKNRNKQKAQQLFPQLKITHAVADALLIAEYGRRVNTGISEAQI